MASLWRIALIVVFTLKLHPAVSERLEDCNCHANCEGSASPCVSEPVSDSLTVDCDRLTVHWRTSVSNTARVFLGTVCDGNIVKTTDTASPHMNGSATLPSKLIGRECTIIGCVRDSNFCTHLFLNATCPSPRTESTPSASQMPTTSSPSYDVTPEVSSQFPVGSLQTGSLSGPVSLLEIILPSSAIVLFVIILAALTTLIYKLYCVPYRRQRAILLSNRLQPFNIDYEEEEKLDDLVVAGMASFRTYSMTSVLTILDPLSHGPTYSENSHHQIHKKYRIAQDLGRLPCSEHTHEALGSGFTLPLSQSGSCVSYNPQDVPACDVRLVPLASEDTQGGDEGKIWSDLDMTCFSESDNENFEGDRDSKNYFKPENLENCQILPGGKFADSSYFSGQDSRMSMKTEASSTKEDITDDSLDLGRMVTGHSAEITRVKHGIVESGSVQENPGSATECSSACEPLGEGFQKNPQVLQRDDRSLCFNPSSNTGTDDSGFASSDGVLA